MVFFERELLENVEPDDPELPAASTAGATRTKPANSNALNPYRLFIGYSFQTVTNSSPLQQNIIDSDRAANLLVPGGSNTR